MKKAVLIVTIEFPPLPGGIGNHACNLAQQFAEAKHPVTVLTEYRANSEQQWSDFTASIPGVKVIGVRRNSLILLTYLRRIFLFLLLSRQHEIVVFSGRFSIWLGAISRTKGRSVAVIHGSELKLNGIFHSVFQKGLDRMNHIVSVSNYTQQILLNTYSVSPEKCSVINNGFTPIRGQVLRNHTLVFKAPVFITVGSMHKRKGQHNFIAAIPQLLLKYPHLTYIVAGVPSELDRLTKLASDLGIMDHIEFVNTPSDNEVAALLQRSDIFVMLSENLDNGDFEGFGIAILEAMYMKLPAIGSLNTGIEDAISDHHSGILVDPHSIKQIVAAADTILNDYEQYALRASRWSTQFLWPTIMDNYFDLVNR